MTQEAARVMPRRLPSPDEALGLLRRELGPVADETRGLELRFEVPAGVRPEVVALLAHRIRLAGPGSIVALSHRGSGQLEFMSTLLRTVPCAVQEPLAVAGPAAAAGASRKMQASMRHWLRREESV